MRDLLTIKVFVLFNVLSNSIDFLPHLETAVKIGLNFVLFLVALKTLNNKKNDSNSN